MHAPGQAGTAAHADLDGAEPGRWEDEVGVISPRGNAVERAARRRRRAEKVVRASAQRASDRDVTLLLRVHIRGAEKCHVDGAALVRGGPVRRAIGRGMIVAARLAVRNELVE